LALDEVNEASLIIQKAAHENANIIFGAVLDESLKEQVKITVIAAGFKDAPSRRLTQQKPAYLPKDWKSVRDTSQPVAAESVVSQVSRNVSSVISEIPANDLDVPTFLRRAHKAGM